MKWYSRSRSVPASPRGLPADAIAATPGCMSMVHHLIFAPGAGCVGRPPSSNHSVVSSTTSHKLTSSSPASQQKGGLEAPRNSLELDADQLRDIQIGVQVEPPFDALAVSGRRSTGSRATAPPSEAGTPRTPSLVARLMGLDGLPDDDACSPSPGLNNNPRAAAAAVKEKKKRVIPESMNRQPLRTLSCNVGAGDARSLPDTPRASASSARTAPTWDVVDRPRLSLQVLKENVLDRAAQYMSMPTSPTSSSKKKKDRRDRDAGGHQRRDAKEHAREIVRHAKETVTNRKSGAKHKPATGSPGCDKENAIPFAVQDKKMVAVQVQATAGSIVVTPTAPPPPKVQADQPHAPRLPPPPPPLRAKPSRPPPPPPPPDHPIPAASTRAAPLSPQAVQCKRPQAGCERFATRIKKSAAEATIDKVAPPSSPTAVAAVAVAPAASSHARRKLHPSLASTSSSLEDDPEYGYLRTVLERGGFMRATPPPQRPFKGQSASSPVDPIVFHLLELDRPADDLDDRRLGPLRHRWNRKLLFHLAQEILADLLHLHVDIDGSSAGTRPHGPALLSKVWGTVKAFPAADCRVVGDIDALVARDLGSASARGLARHPAVAEEAGDVAEDVAELVLDALLRESFPPSSSWSWSPARVPR